MLKKSTLICLIIVFLIFPSTILATNSSFDKSRLHNGLITVVNHSKNNGKKKVIISKEHEKYTYDLKSNNTFPLQLGNGKYTISIYENIQGNKYKLIEEDEVNLVLNDKNEVFLQSIQIINWNENMESIKKAKELTKDAKNDMEKIEAIYNYIVNNISYDNIKAEIVQAGYVPDIDEILKSNSGICYDYVSLFAGMLRSVGLPTKLIMGYKKDIEQYHAWNQVYLKDSNKWITIDTTYDAAFVKNKLNISMIKSSKEYIVEKTY